MGSRLEPMGETHGPDIGFLDQILRFRAVPGQVDGEVVEGIQVREGLPPELFVAHRSNQRRGRSDGRTSCSSSSAATSSRMVW